MPARCSARRRSCFEARSSFFADSLAPQHERFEYYPRGGVNMFFVYILRCSDGSYYTGHTDNLEARLAAHQIGEIDGYTSTRRPVHLLWSEWVGTRDEALESELRIKGWSR